MEDAVKFVFLNPAFKTLNGGMGPPSLDCRLAPSWIGHWCLRFAPLLQDGFMATILHLDASVRGDRSLSRGLSRHFMKNWRERRPNDEVIYRDLGREPPAFVTESWIAAVFTKPEERTAAQRAEVSLSDKMIDELKRADMIVLGTPMYNYGMPAPLKAWFDQVIRIDETFSFDLARGDYPLEPIMNGKMLVTLTSHGEFGFATGGVRQNMDHLVPHILTCAHYLGVSETHHIAIEYQEFGGERHERSVAIAHEAAVRMVDHLAQSIGQSRAAAE